MQKVDNALARNAQMQGRFQAQVAQSLGDLQKLAERAPELRTGLQNLSKLDASPDTDQLITKIDAELTKIEREHDKVQATVANIRQELQWATADRDKLEAIWNTLRQKVEEFENVADLARQNLNLLADRGEYLVQHARIQTLLDECAKGNEVESPLPQLQKLAGNVELPGIDDVPPAGKSTLDPEKFRACRKQGGEVDACRRAAGGQ
jgi:chromosome segregation ATPase